MSDFIAAVLARIEEIFDPQTVGELLVKLMANVVVGLTVLAVFYVAWRIVALFLRVTLRRTGIDATTASFVQTLAKFGVFVIAIVTALDAAGVQTSAVLASLGVVGLTIGFAARDALSNIISGILIFLDRPFTIDDLVEIEGVYGRVDKITLRSTRVVTPDGRMLAVPNTTVVNNMVASYTNFPHLRIDVKITIGLAEEIERVRRILLEIVRQDPSYLDKPAPRVIVVELNDYNVGIELQAWLDDERQHVEKRVELRERAYDELRRQGVEMPLETIQLSPFEARVASAPGGADA